MSKNRQNISAKNVKTGKQLMNIGHIIMVLTIANPSLAFKMAHTLIVSPKISQQLFLTISQL